MQNSSVMRQSPMASYSSAEHQSSVHTKYKKKLRKLKSTIENLVFENAALCDQVSQVQESIVHVKDERRFLLKRLMDLDKDLATELSKRQNQGDGTQSTRRPYKKRAKKNAEQSTEAAANESTDSPTLPLDLGPLHILCIGQLITDRSNYHAEHYVYPSGYVATRNFAHIKNIDEKCTYTCRIIENGDSPRFEIIPEPDTEFVIAGPTPDLCHAALIQTINENTGQSTELCPQGEWFFGLTHPTVIRLIENNPNIDKCVKFKGFNGNSSAENSTSLSSWSFGASKQDISSYHTVLEVKEEPPDELF